MPAVANEIEIPLENFPTQGSPTSVAFHSRPEVFDAPQQEDETYEDLSPDSLFKQMEDLEWKSAIYHMRNEPLDVSRWIVKRGASDGEIMWRRLPIHEACIRKPTSEIIYYLLDIYPKGVKEQDNNGRLPIHHACIHGASTDVIYQLLNGFPEALEVKDIWGKTPKECALSSVHANKDEVVDAFMSKDSDEIMAMANQAVRDVLEANCHNAFEIKLASTCLDKQDTNLQSAQNSGNNMITEIAMDKLERELTEAKIASAAAVEERDLAVERQKELLEKIEELEGQLRDQSQDFTAKEEVLMEENETLSNRNTYMKFSFDKLETQVASFETILKAKDEVIKDLEGTVQGAEVKLQKRLDEAVEDYKIKVEAIEKDRDQLQVALTTVTNKLRDVKTNIKSYTDAAIKEEREKLLHDSQIWEEKIETTLLKNIDLQKKAATLQNVKDDLEKKCEMKDTENIELNREFTILKDRLETTEKMKNELQDYREKGDVRMNALEGLIEDYQVKIKTGQARTDALEAELNLVIEHQRTRTIEKFNMQREMEDLRSEVFELENQIKVMRDSSLISNAEKLIAENEHEDDSASVISSAKKKDELIEVVRAFIKTQSL